MERRKIKYKTKGEPVVRISRIRQQPASDYYDDDRPEYGEWNDWGAYGDSGFPNLSGRRYPSEDQDRIFPLR